MPELLSEHAWRLAAMACLLTLSAFFSGSETALFSLSRDRLRRFRAGPHRTERLAARLVAQPRSLLVTLLLGNTIVNVTFYAISSSVVWSIGTRNHALGVAAGILVLLTVIVCGEVGPKTVAATAPEGLARLAGVPLWGLRWVLRPVVYVLDHWVVEPLTRLVTGQGTRSRQLLVTTEELQAIVELAGDEGAVGRDESDMINEVLELHEVRVREVMVPRVDMVAFDVDEPTARLLDEFRRTRLKRMVIYRGSVDEVVGLVSSRRAFLEPGASVRALLEQVRFVPEQATVETVLRLFRQEQIQMAVVVDEYGGTAGLVTMEDCMEQIVGDIQDEYDHLEAQVERLSEREFLLDANLSMRAWSDYVLTELDTEMDVVTLGGFVTGLLGRLPREGDQCSWGNLRFTVRSLGRHRSGAHGWPKKIMVEILGDTPTADGRGGPQ
ncbi:MAG: HlyC/CorC family transporter [Planctomycetes bacterium]|nr:HlyC/CorC family transporter [Planctomycetota bacterium]